MAIDVTPINEAIDYQSSMVTQASQYWIAKEFSPTAGGWFRHASPTGEINHTKEFFLPSDNIKMSMPSLHRELSEAEGKALWLALGDSTQLIQKGRLLQK